MITAYEVSKNPGAVHSFHPRYARDAPSAAYAPGSGYIRVHTGT